jgi:iron complex outermembrane receptor protein
MTNRSRRLYSQLLCGAAMAGALGAAGGAWAQEAATFAIPRQSLASALSTFSEQAGRPVLYRPEIASAKVSPGASGALQTEVALNQLLNGTGLSWTRDGDTFLIVKADTGPQSGSAAGGGAEVEALIVTAQKREENIQDVPIAISAFSQEALDEQKIEGGFDLLKGIPNVTFSKNNYSGYNFSIRGVGTKAVSATSDPGVAVSFNNVSLIRNRLFEQEYLDVERVEVLRGPQGTLYGRNATSGVINVVTAKPDLANFEGRVKVEVGNYDARRASAFVNVPLIEGVAALRLAGAFTQRDGYGYNLATNDSVDGRGLWTGRASLAFEPNDRFRANLVWERFEEDDNRLRTGKQLCHRDPGPESIPGHPALSTLFSARLSQGCRPGSLYDQEAFGAPNGLSIPFVLAGQMVAAYGFDEPEYFPDGTLNPDADRFYFMTPGVDPYGADQSTDLRTISSLREAQYQAKADILALDLTFDLTDALTLTSQTLYNEDRVYSFQDYNRFATVPSFTDSTQAYNFFCYDIFAPDPVATCGEGSDLAGFAPGGMFNDPQIGPANTLAGFEISSSESTQFSQDFRLQSSFEGPLNFSGGVNYTRFKGLNDYYLFFNIVTMLAQGMYNRSTEMGECSGLTGGFNCMAVDPNPIESLSGDGHNYFRNKNPYKLESKAAFGELYWEATEDLKVTAGIRYTDDRKTFTPWRSQLLVPGYEYGAAAPINQRWTEVTGRLGVDWKPVLSFTDETMVYAFYSRGYKGGGANPPPSAPSNVQFPAAEHPVTFEPEFVDAFEVGSKNVLLGGALTLNTSAFFYDYKDYQVSKVVDRTIVNENFDATIWGAELEGVWRPTRELRINATLGYLDTKIADGEQSIDIFNRTQGREGWMLVTPWIQQTSNCILPTEVVSDLLDFGIFPGFAAFASPIVQACGIYSPGYISPFTDYDPDDYPETNNGAGFYDELGGNELPNAPHWTFNIGAQYTLALSGGWEATVRGDYYRQAESYARVYNLEADRLRAWDNANLSLRIERPDDALTFELYAKNLFDETPITDAFLNSDSTGMTTNIFVLDPRLIGLSITKGF